MMSLNVKGQLARTQGADVILQAVGTARGHYGIHGDLARGGLDSTGDGGLCRIQSTQAAAVPGGGM